MTPTSADPAEGICHSKETGLPMENSGKVFVFIVSTQSGPASG